MTTDPNPLLIDAPRPAFADIRPEHVAPAMAQALADHRAAMDAIMATRGGDFDSVFMARERADAVIDQIWSAVNHLQSVCDTPELRAAVDGARPELVRHAMAVAQDPRLYAVLRDLTPRDPQEQAALAAALRDLELSGVALPDEARARFAAIKVELSALKSAFGNAVLDATAAWHEDVTEEALLAGVPEADKTRFAAEAAANGVTGWRVTLHQPSIRAILAHADNRDLRFRVYEASGTRASDRGPNAGQFDNGPRIVDILKLSQEAAELLGHADHTGVSLATKMARDSDEVIAFLRGLAAQAKPFAERDLASLRAFAADRLGIADMQPWDTGYVVEKLRVDRHALDETAIRAYFPVPKVLDGLFTLLDRLFGLRFEARDDVETWHPDVRYYDLRRGDGPVFAGIYLDLFAREGKKGGAWMDVCRPRLKQAAGEQLPIAQLVCNFAAPTGGRPALLSHDDVVTTLHEIGHCLHHLLTEVSIPSVGGITGYEWDAVELPSQLMENFAWDREGLRLMSGHVDTGAVLPDDLLDRMLGARTFQSGLFLLRQVEMGLFDLLIHREGAAVDADTVARLLAQVRGEVAVSTPPEWHRFAHAFSHVFAGGYASGYYSYLWAERLAADAFDRFAEDGTVSAAVGDAFRQEILSRGATRPAIDSFVAFRGRAPNDDALLRRYGLAA